MFVSIVCEISNDDHKIAVKHLLIEYGFKQIFEILYESTTIKEKELARLKRDIDRRTDSYDSVRIYQYPLDEVLVITTLRDKRWRRVTVKA
ncbi:MAG: CRISPR-associated protein Cas2 [Spirochaetales bacterium]|nr:CRISPR-associated protein Cas2 [Spirochaetales bacterium]